MLIKETLESSKTFNVMGHLIEPIDDGKNQYDFMDYTLFIGSQNLIFNPVIFIHTKAILTKFVWICIHERFFQC